MRLCVRLTFCARRATVARLRAAVLSRKLVPVESSPGAALELLTGMYALVLPEKPWHLPLAMALAFAPPAPAPSAEADEADEANGAALPAPPPGPRLLTLTFRFFAHRLLFELIACDHIAAVMKHLAPAGAGVVSPLRPLPSSPRRLFSEPRRADDDEFSLPSLLRGMEHGGCGEAHQPASVALPMHGFQRQALKWCEEQEARPGGLNSEFWEARAWDGEAHGGGGTAIAAAFASAADDGGDDDDGRCFWYFPAAGELRLQRPPVVRGGLLASQMGAQKCGASCPPALESHEFSRVSRA